MAIAIGYVLGIIWGVYNKKSILLFYCFLLICFLLLTYFSQAKIPRDKRTYLKIKLKHHLKNNYKLLVIGLLLLGLSFFISNTYVNYKNKEFDTKYHALQDKKVYIIGTIVSDGVEKEYNIVYELKVDELNGDKKYHNTKLLLYVKKEKGNVLEYGNKIEIEGTYQEASTARNEKGFDYKDFLKAENIYGIIKSTNKKITVKSKVNLNPILMLSNHIKNSIKENIQDMLPGETGNLLVGMLLGDKNDLDKDIKEYLKESNFSHVLSVSGLQVAYILLRY